MPGACRRCGHHADAHEHFRRGSDCGLCGCRRRQYPLTWYSWLALRVLDRIAEAMEKEG